MKKFALALLVIAAVLALTAFLARGPLTLRLMERGVRANMLSSLLDELPEGLHVALCGAGSPLPDPKRSGPCTAVVAGKRLFVVDAGAGASRMLSTLRLPQGAIEAVLLTHFHSDHIDGLGEVLLQRWVGGAHQAPTPVFGPDGVEQVVEGLNLAYAADRVYRVEHHGEAIVPGSGHGGAAQPFAAPAPGEAHTVLEDGELAIRAFLVSHDPVRPAVGYRFDYRGRSVVISGDTVRSENLERFAQGVDLLVHEALAPQLVGVLTRAARAAGRDNLAKITIDILDYHASPVDAALSATRVGAKHLLFHHIVPPLILPTMEALFVEGVAEVYTGPFTVGRDGTLVKMPAGESDVEVVQLL